MKEIERLEKKADREHERLVELFDSNSKANKEFEEELAKMQEAVPLLKHTYISMVVFAIVAFIILTTLFIMCVSSGENWVGFMVAWLAGVFLYGIIMMFLAFFIPSSIEKKYGLVSSKTSFRDKMEDFFGGLIAWILLSIPGLQSIVGLGLLSDPDHENARKKIEEKRQDYSNARRFAIDFSISEKKTANDQLKKLKSECPSICEVNEAKDISRVKVGVTITWEKSGKCCKVTDIKWDSGIMVYSLEYEDGTTGFCIKGNLYDDCLCDDTGKIIIK